MGPFLHLERERVRGNSTGLLMLCGNLAAGPGTGQVAWPGVVTRGSARGPGGVLSTRTSTMDAKDLHHDSRAQESPGNH